ncbi:MAG: DUF7736 domain-containing protein [Planctomycetota bacterium]|jgi:hypothetical protein
MGDQITKTQALSLYGSGFWKGMSNKEIAMFQMETERLCMPFDVFHAAIEAALGRPVWTHEFGLNRDGLLQELRGERTAPSFAEILDLIPENKRILVAAQGPTEGTHRD